MDYLVEGAVITNRLIFTDGRVVNNIMGGGAFYAYTAVRMCTDSCMFVGAVGNDFDEFYGEWFNGHGCSKEGLTYPMEKTTYNELKYFEDGSYIEYSIYGPEYEKENLPKLYLDPDQYLGYLKSFKGAYLAENMTDKLIKGLEEQKQGCKLMWEIPATWVEPAGNIYREGGMDALRKHLREVDIFSLNKNESFSIFGTDTVDSSIDRLKELGIPTYYRVGTDGAYMIQDGKDYFVPMISTVPAEKEIDPTGCGNTSTAAAMWAFCEGLDPLMVCVVGNVVASYNVRQYGPYPDMSEKTRKEMMTTATVIYNELKEKYYGQK